MTTAGMKGITRRVIRWLIMVTAFGWGGVSFAASSGSGQAYGLEASASVLAILPGPPLVGLGTQFANTGNGSAPPDFNKSGYIANVGVNAAGILKVDTGVLTSSTQSTLTRNSVTSMSQVNGLNLSLLNILFGNQSLLSLGADTITTTATMSCEKGKVVASGRTDVLNGSGPLAGLGLNVSANADVSVLGIATITVNEQIVSPTSITVNAVHVRINVLGLITADVVIGHAEASMADCQSTVTLNDLQNPVAANDLLPVSGTCSPGSNDLAITTLPAGASLSLPCQSDGTYSGTLNVAALPAGAITVTASQTPAGPNSSASKSTVKNPPSNPGAPTVSVTASAITLSNQTSYGVSGTCSAEGQPVTVSIGGIPASATCTGGNWSVSGVNVSGLPDGTITVTASQTVNNQVGQGSTTTNKSTVSNPGDTPVVTVSNAAVINAANQASYGVSGTCSANGQSVVVNIGSIAAQATCSGGAWSVSGVNVTALGDGAVTVTASQTVNNQTGTGTRSTSKDATPPAVAVTSAPAITSANQASYGVSGTCTESGSTVSVSIGSVTVVPSPVCNGGAWSAAGADVSGLPAGPVTVTASQTDAAGNTGTGALTTTKNAAASAVSVTAAPPINASNQSSYGGVTGTCSAGNGTVTVAIGGLTTTTACNGGNWSVSGMTVSSLPDGVVTITASQTINGAAVSGARTTVKDVTPPAVSITAAPTIDGSNQSSYGVSGTCTSSDGTVTVSIGNVAASAPCTNGTWAVSGVKVGGLPAGAVTVTASQTDAAGNVATDTRQVSKTSPADGSGAGSSVGDPQGGNWVITAELNGKPGRGMGIDVQNGKFVMQVYNYTSSGAPTFHIAIGTMDGNKVVAPLTTYQGGRFFGSGPLDGQEAGNAGNVEVVFSSRTTGSIKFPGEEAKAIERFDYEGTPQGTFADPAYVDRWAMVELGQNNQPVSTWWADIGSGEQVGLNYNWTLSPVPWPYAASTKLTMHGFEGSLSTPFFATCDDSGADRIFKCSGVSAQPSAPIALTLQRSVDQVVGTVQFGSGDKHRIIGSRITRAAYSTAAGKTTQTTYFRPDYAPEAGTWIVSNEITGKPGRGLAVDLQKPINSQDHTLFISVYDYESKGNATFHSVLGTHDPSTIPAANRPAIALNQYQGGRYFGSGDLTASYMGNAGNAENIKFTSSSTGTIQFPNEDPVQIERFYFGINKNSIDSLVGSWVVLAHSGAMKSRIFNFVPYSEGSVIDRASGYVCVKDQLRGFNFRCAPAQVGADTPVIRFSTGFYAASRGIEGDGGADPDSTPELMVMRITDADGQPVQAGSMLPADDK